LNEAATTESLIPGNTHNTASAHAAVIHKPYVSKLEAITDLGCLDFLILDFQVRSNVGTNNNNGHLHAGRKDLIYIEAAVGLEPTTLGL
jgi:hypothetical protein